MMKRIITICLLVPNLLCTLFFIEQDVFYPLHAQSNNLLFPKIKDIIGPSPQATAFTRYGEYPVNYNTGLVDMRVPIYTVKSGNLSLPIDISFHASGRMANETNGVLGMRWVLNAGGVITRTVRGYVDERNDLTPYTVNPNHTPSYDELRRSCKEGFLPWEDYNPSYSKNDSEFDEFTYVLPTGKSGRFVIKNENGIKRAVQIPYEALKIELVQDPSYYDYYGAIIITDVDGTVYNYGDGIVYNSNYCEFNEGVQENYVGSVPTGWYLKSIISVDRKDRILFNYQHVSVSKVEGRETIITADRIRDYTTAYAVLYPEDTYGAYLQNYLFGLPREVQNGSYSVMTTPTLSSIKFKDGELNFNYNGQSNIDKTILQNITLSGTVNRKFKFNQELDLNEKELRYLKSLEIASIIGGVEKLEEKYSFDYYKPSPTYSTYFIGASSIRKDWWGYYNGGSGELLPHKSIDFRRNDGDMFQTVYRDIGSYNATRNPDAESIQLGMLKSITYPTGGKTEFEYENNYFKDGTIIKIGPGLRIKKVTNIPIVGNAMIKNYTYGNYEDGTGYINNALQANKNTIQESGMFIYWDYLAGQSSTPFFDYTGYRIRTYSSDPLINTGDFGGNIVRYNLITEYIDEFDSNERKNGKTIYQYSDKIFETKQFVISDKEYYIDYPKVFSELNHIWQGGKLLYKTSYLKKNGIFLPTLKESYNYTDSQFEEVWDMPTYRHVNFSVDCSETAPNFITSFQYTTEKNYHNNNCSVYGYGYRKFVSGSEKISSKTIEHFDGAGISTTTNYFYDSQYDQLKKETTTRSDGKQALVEYDYPFDNTSVAVNTKMVGLNMLSTPLLKSHYVNGVFTQSQKTDYTEYYPDVIRPNTEYYKKSGAVEEPVILYNNYDSKGNPTEIQMANGTKVAYLWGYNQTLPVAKVENATQAQIATLSLNMALIADNGTSDSAMRAELQKIRTGLSNAMVTTYTYTPLLGITSITDPKGDTVYYSYDGVGRLEYVRDAQGNILSKNEYHHKN